MVDVLTLQARRWTLGQLVSSVSEPISSWALPNRSPGLTVTSKGQKKER